MAASTPLVRPTITKFSETGTRDGSSPTETFGVDTSAATRKFFVPWAQRFNASLAILGYSQIGYIDDDPLNPPDGLRRLTPLEHPDLATWHAAKITNVTGHRFTTKRTASDSSIANQFDLARIEVAYENLGYGVLADTSITWPTDEYRRWTSVGEGRTSTDYVTLPGGIIKYSRQPPDTSAPNDRAIPFNTGIVLPILELPVMWHRVPYGVFDVLNPGPWMKRIWGLTPGTLPYIGSVNKSSFLGFLPGQLLLLNVRPIPRRSDFFYSEWDIEFTFGLDPRKWNHKAYITADADTEWLPVFKAPGGTLTWYADGTIPDGVSLYNEREFIELFQVY